MSELARGFGHQRRRWPGILLAIIGVIGIAGWWLAPPLVRAVADFFGATLADKDSYSSVVSMFIGAASFLASIIFGLLQLRQGRRSGTEESQTPRLRREREAIDRLRVHLGRQDTLRRIGDVATRALALRVHPAIDIPQVAAVSATAGSPNGESPVTGWRRLLSRPRPGRSSSSAGTLDPDLPTFVGRDRFPQVCDWMRKARTDGGFLVLIGDSSVGKTRLLYEAAREVLPDFVVLVLDLGDGELVNTIAEATFPLPKLIVWLDELQRFLDGPYLTPGSTSITTAAVRRLLDAPTPVVIVGTLWPEYASHLRATEPDPDTEAQRTRHPRAVDVLDDRRLHELPLRTFSGHERQVAARLAAHDPRLAEAVADRDYNVTEVLAGAPQLVRRYERATEEQLAVLHAAIDARRLGIQAPLTDQLLCAVARGYLTVIHPDDSWFPPALAELSSANRPHDRATAPLIAVPNTDRSCALGHTVADYLLQRLTRQRRTTRLPAEVWQALIDYVHTPEDTFRLADSAAQRLLYCYAEPLWQRLDDGVATLQLVGLLAEQGRFDELRVRADTGDESAPVLLAHLLAQQGHVDEAIEVLRAHADTGNWFAAHRLADLLAEHGRINEAIEVLRALADAGNTAAAVQLADLLAEQGRIDELKVRADTGDESAADRLADLLAAHGRIDEAIEVLRALAGTGNWSAADRLAKHGHVDEAIKVLRALADAGDESAAVRLAWLLAEHGRIDELRVRADTGDESAAFELARLLAKQGRIDELQIRADTGDGLAAVELTELLAAHGCIDEAIEVLRAHADAGNWSAADRLADLLAKHGYVDEAIKVLRAHADAGNTSAAHRLADLLAEQGRIDELAAEIDAGTPYAAGCLIALLAEQGQAGRTKAESMRRFGLRPGVGEVS